MDALIGLGMRDMSWMLHPGVYVLLFRGEVVYVGQSMNAFGRIGDHTRNKIFDRIFFLRCRPKELLPFEAALIHEYKPRYNKDQNSNRVNLKDSPKEVRAYFGSERRFSKLQLEVGASTRIIRNGKVISLQKRQDVVTAILVTEPINRRGL